MVIHRTGEWEEVPAKLTFLADANDDGDVTLDDDDDLGSARATAPRRMAALARTAAAADAMARVLLVDTRVSRKVYGAPPPKNASTSM